MTITATVSEIAYAGDGVTLAFAIPYVFDTGADIKVVETDASGNAVEITTGFSITGGLGSTGTCTFVAAPASGVTITILDDPEITQTADYTANDDFPADAHEAALDRGVRISKRLSEQIKRSLRVEDGDPSGGDGMILASPTARANTILAFDGNGAIEYAISVTNYGTLTQSIIGALFYPQTTAESNAGVTPTNYAKAPYVRGRYSSFANWKLACDQADTEGQLDADYAVSGTTELPVKSDLKGFEITGAFNTNRGPPSTIFFQGGYTLNWNAKQPRIQYAFFNDYSGIHTGLDDAGGVTMGGAGATVGSSWNKIGVKYATSFVLDTQSSYITQNLITGGILRFIPMVGGGNELNANVFDNIDVSATTPAALAMGTVTVSNGSPAVVTWANHGKSFGVAVVFTTTGTLPTGLSTNTVYYVMTAGLTANTFQVSLTPGGAAINTSSAGSGVHTATSFGVLQTDTLRGRNIFRNIYWENGSNVRANAHIIGWHADGLGNPALDRYCHAMFNTNSNQRVITDFLSLSVSNLVTGGNWNILDSTGKPPDLSQSGGGAVSVIADNTDPSGIGLRYEASFAGAFSGFTIVMQPSGSDRFSLVLYYKSTDDFFAITSNDGGGSTSHDPALSLVSQGLLNNWKKLWISGPASKTAGSSVTLFAYGAVGGAAKVMSISGMFAGSEGCVIPPQRQLTRNRFASAVYDPPSLADGAGATTTVALTGAALGDLVQASFSLNLQGIMVTAWVSAADTVSVRFQNESGGVLDLASGTLRVQTQTPYA